MSRTLADHARRPRRFCSCSLDSGAEYIGEAQWTPLRHLAWPHRDTYLAIDGTIYFERRRIKLSKNSQLNEITCRFSLDPRARKPVAGLEVAIGLAARTTNAKHTLAPERGVMAVWDSLQPGGEPFGIGAVVPEGAKMLQQAHTGNGPKADQALAILRTDAKGEIRYRAGFSWPAEGTISNQEIWLRYLEDARRAPTQ